MKSQEKIEIKSEKVRQIIDYPPSLLTKLGTISITIFLFIVFYVLYSTSYTIVDNSGGYRKVITKTIWHWVFG